MHPPRRRPRAAAVTRIDPSVAVLRRGKAAPPTSCYSGPSWLQIRIVIFSTEMPEKNIRKSGADYQGRIIDLVITSVHVLVVL
jgi:hypothetical protein